MDRIRDIIDVIDGNRAPSPMLRLTKWVSTIISPWGQVIEATYPLG